MKPSCLIRAVAVAGLLLTAITASHGQIGTRFPSEKQVVIDPVTGVPLTFLTSSESADSKIYQTHHQWTADGKWLVFRSDRVPGEAMAVNEETGEIVQVTEGGYLGMLNIAQHAMKLFIMQDPNREPGERRQGGPHGPVNIVEVDLSRVFADSTAGKMKDASAYQKILGTIPAAMGAGGDMAIDASEDYAYFRVGRDEAARHLAPDVELEGNYGPRNMGAGPGGLARMDLKTGEISHIVSVPFQVGHVQTNPWVPGEIVFCWETGGKSPQRTWTVMADGTGLRPVYPEAPYEWVTHEAVITRDEVAIAIMGHRRPGVDDAWGIAGTREHPTGLAIVNLRTREMLIAGQTKSGSGLWHVHGSPDGRWAVGDDFSRSIYLIDRHTGEMMLLSTGHKRTAANHPHPTFSMDSTRIQIQSAMLAEDGRTMSICVIPVPPEWLERNYTDES